MSIDARADELVYAFRRNLVVAASAGTGKTHRLTGLYAMLALGLASSGRGADDEAADPVSPSRIVATTFSRAAAREIADRVASSLTGVAADGEDLGRHAAAIEARRAVLRDPPSRDALRTRARRALAELPSARIDTVHGLAARLVLENAVELGLPPGARILDEGESAELDALVVDEALHAALEGGGHGADAARALLDTCGGLATTRTEVASLLARLDEEGAGPDELERGDHVAAAARLRRATLEVAGWVAREGSEKLRAPAAAAAAVLERFGAESIDPALLEEKLVELFGAKVTVKNNAANEALAELRESLGRGTNADRGRSLAQLLIHAPALAAREAQVVDILVDARVRLRRERDARRALSFGDVLRIARDGLRDRPAIAARARASLDALLVDEFQDTSPVQRDLVILLRERPDAARARPAGVAPDTAALEPHGLFLVGDRKQSIYGFRGADVAVFARLCAELGGRAAADALELPPALAREPAVADFVALRASHRSGERLCTFVNEVAVADFGAGAASTDFEVRYGTAERLVSAVTRPHDEVMLARDDGRPLDGVEPFVGSARGPLRAALTAAAIVEGHLLPDHAARTIAVLTRRRSTIPLVELALHRRGIPYVVAGRALFDAIEVRDLAALLRLVLDPRERRALGTVLRGPAVSLSDDALLALSTPGRGLDAERVFGRAPDDDILLEADDRARLGSFRERFAAARPAILRMAPGDAVREAVRAFELDVAMAALPRAAARLGNLASIEALARGRGGGLAAFSRHLEALITSETDGEEAVVFSDDDDAVRITTIHASKGLDFGAVVLLDLEASTALRAPGLGVARVGARMRLLVRHRGEAGARIPSPVLAEAEEELRAREQAERRRLSYVGLTRAKDRLVLVLPSEGEEKKPRSGSLHATLAGLGADLAPLVGRTVDAPSLLEAATAPAPVPTSSAPPPSAPARPERPAIATVALATTPLGTFRECPRRFRLRHLLGFDEPVATSQLELFELPSDEPAEDPAGGELGPGVEPDGPGEVTPGDDPRSQGRAAHRVLETWPLARWGAPPELEALATRLADEGLTPFAAQQLAPGLGAFLGSGFARRAAAASRTAREHPFVVHVAGLGAHPGVELRGAVDLLVVDGAEAFVVDYKLASPAKDLASWEFQLRTYALAARQIEGVERVTAGVVFLRGQAAEPRWLRGAGPGGALAEAEHRAHERELGALGARYAAARWDDRWDGVPRARCDALRCGFVTACHGRPRARRP